MSGVIRTDQEKEVLIAMIRAMDWSFKYYIQDLFPKAKPKQYNYLFGIIYQRIADFSGYTDVWAVHKDLMIHFNVEYSPLPDGTWEFRRKAGNEFHTISISQYIEKIRAYFITDHNLAIEDDYEILVNE